MHNSGAMCRGIAELWLGLAVEKWHPWQIIGAQAPHSNCRPGLGSLSAFSPSAPGITTT
jgi:hypothetical protein